MWSKASARIRVSLGGPRYSIRGERSPASTRAAIRAIRRSGLANPAANRTPASSATASVAEPPIAKLRVIPRVASSTGCSDCVDGDPRLRAAGQRERVHVDAQAGVGLRHVGRRESDRAASQRARERRHVLWLSHRVEELGVVGCDRLARDDRVEQGGGRGERLGADVARRARGDGARADVGLRRGERRGEGLRLGAKGAVDLAAQARVGLAVDDDEGDHEGQDEDAAERERQAPATANLPISHSAVRSVQAGILLESAPRTGDGRNGTWERFAPCAGPLSWVVPPARHDVREMLFQK